MTPPTISELIFSEQANHNFSKTLGEIKRHTLSIQNRLQSILEDAAFVQRVSAAYGRPLIANERCGSWYIDPTYKDGNAYFKSTDGHTGVWSFSMRRLNTHLLETIGNHDGCIIVDSTRRGKRMPDALSKTIPIWCSVLNRSLFPDTVECHELYTPPQIVSSSEHAQINARLNDFLLSFLALDIDRETLRAQITKPLRPMWVTPESYISFEDTIFEDYHPIICCTASRRVPGGEISEGGYIQGSGDDTENWAFGLTPPVYWANKRLLLSASESKLPELISELIASSSSSSINQASRLASIPPTTSLLITDLKTVASQPADKHRLTITIHPELTLPNDAQPTPHNLPIALGPHKLGSRNLRTELPNIINFVSKHVSHDDPETNNPTPETSIAVACSSASRDHSVGVALALLCLFYNDSGQLVGRKDGPGSHESNGELREQGSESQGSVEAKINKLYIRRRLGWIVTAMPDANPSGATLQSVNWFLMPKR